MTSLLPIMFGIMFVLLFMRLLPSLVLELAWFGAVFGGIELWHYHGTAFLGLPQLPLPLLQFAAVGALAWVFFRIVFIISLLPIPYIQPTLRYFSLWVNGNKRLI